MNIKEVPTLMEFVVLREQIINKRVLHSMVCI